MFFIYTLEGILSRMHMLLSNCLQEGSEFAKIEERILVTEMRQNAFVF